MIRDRRKHGDSSMRSAKRQKSAKSAGGGETERREVRSYLVRVDPEGMRQLRILAAELDSTLQNVTIDALNAMLRSHGKPAIVENPRGPRGRPRLS